MVVLRSKYMGALARLEAEQERSRRLDLKVGRLQEELWEAQYGRKRDETIRRLQSRLARLEAHNKALKETVVRLGGAVLELD